MLRRARSGGVCYVCLPSRRVACAALAHGDKLKQTPTRDIGASLVYLRASHTHSPARVISSRSHEHASHDTIPMLMRKHIQTSITLMFRCERDRMLFVRWQGHSFLCALSVPFFFPPPLDVTACLTLVSTVCCRNRQPSSPGGSIPFSWLIISRNPL